MRADAVADRPAAAPGISFGRLRRQLKQHWTEKIAAGNETLRQRNAALAGDQAAENRSCMSILVTGAAGFIGFHVAKALLERGERVVGIDNLNDYYDVRLKEARLAELRGFPGFSFAKLDVADRDGVLALVERHKDLRSIIHLAAQAGVRYSLENPYAYIDANVTGTLVMLEAARRIDNLTAITYASSSSVYGANQKQPFSVDDRVDQPVSLYAATKRSCELIAHTYATSMVCRRPDCGSLPFTARGAGRIWRPICSPGRSSPANRSRSSTKAGWRATSPISTTSSPARSRRMTARRRLPRRGSPSDLQSRQSPPRKAARLHRRPRARARPHRAQSSCCRCSPAMCPESFADIEASRRDLGFEPKTTIEVGLARFVQWYKRYHQVN